MNIEMPAVRLLFSGRDDAGKYIFTVLSYRPDNYDKFRVIQSFPFIVEVRGY